MVQYQGFLAANGSECQRSDKAARLHIQTPARMHIPLTYADTDPKMHSMDW